MNSGVHTSASIHVHTDACVFYKLHDTFTCVTKHGCLSFLQVVVSACKQRAQWERETAPVFPL